MVDNETNLENKNTPLMTNAEILNNIAEMIIDKIRNNEEYKDVVSWYACFESIERDIKEGRKLLNSVEQRLG